MENKADNFKTILVLSVVISLLTGSVFGGLAGFLISKKNQPRVANEQTAAIGEETVNLVKEESAVINAVKKVSPAVVSIIISKDLPKIRSFDNDPFSEFFGMGEDDPFSEFFGNGHEGQKQEIGGGTGFVVTKNGLIATNKHVIADDQAEYTVLMNDGTRHKAKIIGKDPSNDLGFIKIEKTNLKTAELANSGKLEIGQTVIAIGNALGEFRNTVSTGVISGLKRSITAGSGGGAPEQLSGVIQTDAAINVGNSGGPLLNLKGQVIGINTAIAGRGQNIGFAIPINDAKSDIESIIKSGRIVKPFLGVRYVMIDKVVKSRLGLKEDAGALITGSRNQNDTPVVPDSPADKAGIMEKDIIIEMNGEKVNSENPLYKIIGKHKVGDTVTITIIRSGKKMDLKAKLTESK